MQVSVVPSILVSLVPSVTICRHVRRAPKTRKLFVSATKAVPSCNVCLPTNLCSLPTKLVAFHQHSPTHQKWPPKFSNRAMNSLTAKSFTIDSRVLYRTCARRCQFSAYHPLKGPKNWLSTILLMPKFYRIIWNIRWLRWFSIQWKRMLARNNLHVCRPWITHPRTPAKWLISWDWHSIVPDRQSSHVNWLKLSLVLPLWHKEMDLYIAFQSTLE